MQIVGVKTKMLHWGSSDISASYPGRVQCTGGTGCLNFRFPYLVFPVPTPSVVVPTSVLFLHLLQNITQRSGWSPPLDPPLQFPGSWIPPPWESCFTTSALLPSVDFLPPLLQGSRPFALPHPNVAILLIASYYYKDKKFSVRNAESVLVEMGL